MQGAASAGDLVAAFAKAQDHPRECRLVANGAAPVKETITCDVDLGRLPGCEIQPRRCLGRRLPRQHE